VQVWGVLETIACRALTAHLGKPSAVHPKPSSHAAGIAHSISRQHVVVASRLADGRQQLRLTLPLRRVPGEQRLTGLAVAVELSAILVIRRIGGAVEASESVLVAHATHLPARLAVVERCSEWLPLARCATLLREGLGSVV